MGKDAKIPLIFSVPLFGILFFHMVCESMVIPILAPTLAEPASAVHDMLEGFSPAAHKFFYGVALASYPVIVFLCAPVIGALSDSVGRRPVLLLAAAGTIVGCLGQAIGMEILSLGLFIAGRLLVGATAGVDGAVQAAMLDRCSSEKQKNFYLGASLLAMSTGFMFGPALAAATIGDGAGSFAWSIPFFILAATFVAILFAVFKTLPSDAPPALKPEKIKWFSGIADIATLAKIRAARAMLSIFVLNQTAGGCFMALTPLVLAKSYGFSIKEIAAFMSVQGVFSSIVFGLVGPKLIAYFSKSSALRFSALMCLVSTVYMYITDVGNFIWLLCALQPLGFALSYYVMLSLFSDAAQKSRRGWLLSVLASLWGLTSGMGLLLCGILVGFSNEHCLWACAAMSAAALALCAKKIGAFRME